MTNNDFKWPVGKRGALSVSFDDGRPSQVDVGIPILDQFNAKGTFYVLPKGIEQRLDAWHRAVASGHEIGNHTVTHPCTGNYKFSAHNALEDYTLERMDGELIQASSEIERLLKITPKTFAYPCSQSFVGRDETCQSYVPLIARRFLAGRNGGESENNPAFCDLAQLTAMGSDEAGFDSLKKLIDNAIEQRGWLILVGHDIGKPAFQCTDARVLEQICKYAQDSANGIWLDTIATIAAHIKAQRS